MEASSIITQVTREEDQITSFAQEKGKPWLPVSSSTTKRNSLRKLKLQLYDFNSSLAFNSIREMNISIALSPHKVWTDGGPVGSGDGKKGKWPPDSMNYLSNGSILQHLRVRFTLQSWWKQPAGPAVAEVWRNRKRDSGRGCCVAAWVDAAETRSRGRNHQTMVPDYISPQSDRDA